jgi:Integrase core domain
VDVDPLGDRAAVGMAQLCGDDACWFLLGRHRRGQGMAQHMGMGGQPDAGGEAGKGAAGVVATAGSTCSVFAAEGIRVLRTPVRAPRANAHAERWVGTVRREVLDRMLILGCRRLRSVLAEYADHYNGHRPHRALGQAPPLAPGEPVVLAPAGRIVRRDRLGGLIHEYGQVA